MMIKKQTLALLAFFMVILPTMSARHDPKWEKFKENLHKTTSFSLHRTVNNGDLNRVKFLVTKLKQDINARNKRGVSPLHWAFNKNIWSEQDDPELARWLLEHGADVHASDKKNNTPLHHAVSDGSVKGVKLLLAHGASANAQNIDGWTPLALTTEHTRLPAPNIFSTKTISVPSCLEIAQTLINAGADINKTLNNGATPLILAVENKNIELAKLLVKHGANPHTYMPDINATNNKVFVMRAWSPLHSATRNGDTIMINWLIDEEKVAYNTTSDYGFTPLHSAATHGQFDAFMNLVARGPLPTAPSIEIRTLLHHAAEGGNVAIVLWLLEHGADANAKTNDGRTPTDLATNDAVKILLKKYQETDAILKKA